MSSKYVDDALNEARKHGYKVDPCEVRTVTNGPASAIFVPLEREDDEDFDEVKVFRDGLTFATDLIHLEIEDLAGFYFVEFAFTPGQQAKLQLKAAGDGNSVDAGWSFDTERGLQPQGSGARNQAINSLLASEYVNACTKWRGRRRRSRLCIGKGCDRGFICIEWIRTIF